MNRRIDRNDPDGSSSEKAPQGMEVEGSPKSSWQKLYEIFTPRERFQALLLFGASLFTALVQAGGIGAIFPFINVLMNPKVIQENRWLRLFFEKGGFSTPEQFTLFLGSAVLGVILLSSLAPALISWARTRFLLNKNHFLSTRLLTVYLSRPYAYFLERNTNEMGKNVLTEVWQITMGLLLAVFELLTQGILLIVLVGMLLVVDVKVTLGAMVLLGGGYRILDYCIKRKLKTSGAESLEANELRYTLANEALSGIKTNRVMGIEAYYLEQFRRCSLHFSRTNIFSTLAGELPRYFLEGLAFGGIVSFLLFRMVGGSPVSDLIPLVSLYAFAAYRMMPAVHRCYSALTRVYFYQATLDRIHEDMFADVAALEPLSDDGGTLVFRERICLRDIHFRYDEASDDVIEGLDLTIPKESTIGFVGSTGSGKTTLVDILLGLLLPRRGVLEVDGVPIDKNNVRAWRRLIGYVPQEIYLSDASIRRNIAFGVPEEQVDEEAVREAARIAALDEFIDTLSEGYDTLIGERGVRLSGGQRQRIGLARALYRKPEILVLDEATSSLDGATEQAVLDAVRNASRSRTVIMIAHRLNTLRDCDQIFLMQEGRFADQGTYDHLIQQNRAFRRMAKLGVVERA